MSRKVIHLTVVRSVSDEIDEFEEKKQQSVDCQSEPPRPGFFDDYYLRWRTTWFMEEYLTDTDLEGEWSQVPNPAAGSQRATDWAMRHYLYITAALESLEPAGQTAYALGQIFASNNREIVQHFRAAMPAASNENIPKGLGRRWQASMLAARNSWLLSKRSLGEARQLLMEAHEKARSHIRSNLQAAEGIGKA